MSILEMGKASFLASEMDSRFDSIFLLTAFA